MTMAMSMDMSIRTITLIATPIATGLARNMLILIPTSMITTRITITTTSIIPIRITTMLTATKIAMATITTIMAWAPPMPTRRA